MAKKKRVKAQALPAAQTRDEAAGLIREIGDKQREFLRVQAAMNDAIAQAAHDAEPTLAQLTEEIEQLQARVQGWCEANRAELTKGGKVKTADLVTGEVQWRQRPPSVTLTGVRAVVAWLKSHNLSRFIRTSEEVNKEAILNEQEAVADVPGIRINKGVEDFVITPFEQTA